MSQSVLDGVVAIEAKAAKRVADATAQAKALRDEVEAKLAGLSAELDAEAQQATCSHAQSVAASKEKALAALDEQRAAALAALEGVQSKHLGSMATEVAALLERGDDGH